MTFWRARALLEKALVLDPNHAHAKALNCRLAMTARSEGWLRMDEAAFCLPLADDVVADLRTDAMALAFAGHTIAFLGRQQHRGVAILRRAHALNPNSSHVLNASGWVQSHADDNATAIGHFRRSIRLNPLDPIIGQTLSGLGATYMQAGRIDEAVATLEQALADAPEYTASHLGHAWGYWEIGRIDDARRMGALLLIREPAMCISATLREPPFQSAGHLQRLAGFLRGFGVPE